MWSWRKTLLVCCRRANDRILPSLGDQMEDHMARLAVGPAVIGLILAIGTAAMAETPKEAVGFWGTVTGTVKSARPTAHHSF